MGLVSRLLGRKGTTREAPPVAVRVTYEVGSLPPVEVKDARGRSEITDEMVLLGGQGRVQVVGESYRQEALDQICGGKCPEGHMLLVWARLIREPDNPYDANAVRVEVGGKHVGYLDRQSAVEYRGVLKTVESAGKTAVARAMIRGGWDRGGGDEGHYGIELELSSPAVLEKSRAVSRLNPQSPG